MAKKRCHKGMPSGDGHSTARGKFGQGQVGWKRKKCLGGLPERTWNSSMSKRPK